LKQNTNRIVIVWIVYSIALLSGGVCFGDIALLGFAMWILSYDEYACERENPKGTKVLKVEVVLLQSAGSPTESLKV